MTAPKPENNQTEFREVSAALAIAAPIKPNRETTPKVTPP
jgi:hypothetical protein